MNLSMNMANTNSFGGLMTMDNEAMLRKIAVEIMGAETEEQINNVLHSFIRLLIG